EVALDRGRDVARELVREERLGEAPACPEGGSPPGPLGWGVRTAHQGVAARAWADWFGLCDSRSGDPGIARNRTKLSTTIPAMVRIAWRMRRRRYRDAMVGPDYRDDTPGERRPPITPPRRRRSVACSGRRPRRPPR